MFEHGNIYHQGFLKIVLIILFLFLTISLVTTWNAPAEGYESSIYHSTPLVLWIALISSVTVGITIVILTLSGFNSGTGNLWKYGLFLIFLCYAICIGLFIIRGYFLMDFSGDPASHFGWTNEILQDGHIPDELFYPITHIFLSEVSLVTTLNPLLLFRIIPFGVSLLAVLFIYIFVRSLSANQIEPIIAVIIGCTFSYGYFYLILTPNYFANMVLLLVLFLMFKYLDNTNISWKILFSIMLILYPVFHPVPSVFLGICLITLWIPYTLLDVWRVLKKRDRSLLKLHRTHVKVVIPALILLVWWNLWLSLYSSWRWTVQEIYEKIFGEGGSSYLTSLVDQISYAQAFGYNVVEIFLKQYGNPIILSLLSVFSFIILWKTVGRKQEPDNIFLLYGPWAVLCMSIPVLYFFHLGFGPLRFVPYTAILATVFVAYLLSYVLIRHRDSKSRLLFTNIIVIVVLVGLFLAGMLNLYNSPYNMIQNVQTTHTEVSGMNFLFEHRNVTVPISGLTIDPGRFADVLLTPEEKAAQYIPFRHLDVKDIVPWHFGYDTFSSISFSYTRTKNLVITKRDTVIYVDYVPGMAKYRFSSQDFIRLQHDPGASRIYSNGGFDLMTIVPERLKRK